MALYDSNGTQVASGDNITVTTTGDVVSIVKSVSHRGTNTDGKIAGYVGAKQAGFQYGENDLNFTSDGYIICRHDGTINGTSIASLTYAQLMAIDPTIPTLQEWLECMKCIALYPYIDTKRYSGTWSQTGLENAVDVVIEYGYKDMCTWLIGDIAEADIILAKIPNARIGWLATPTAANVTSLLAKRTDDNELFFDSDFQFLTSTYIQSCIDNQIPLEVWTISTTGHFNTAYALSPYISGFTCNGTIVPTAILMAKYISS